ncbi:type I polyketide synthase [Streptomyces violens]|uniref:type I polyketide synthase n=1 Tax=Streptomyces violens TaxID=66377 RepID=UPI0004C1EC50|nr:type I polyketide synthase [Streptomyces violens]
MPETPEAAGEQSRWEPTEPIAIVGVGLRFPGGNETPEEFAEFLRTGRSAEGPAPADRWVSGEDGERSRTAEGNFLDGLDMFDAKFFKISPKEAPYIDPQQRLVLETAWQALENANIDPAGLRDTDAGVYMGVMSMDYLTETVAVPDGEMSGASVPGTAHSAVSGRLSYFLGLRGPCMSVDTACSSSLTSAHLAAQGLRRGECDLALCGGVNAIHHPLIQNTLHKAGMLGSDGRCKTFDESADGYSRGEGCGVLVLKRLSDALRDEDRVLGLLRGSAVRADGESAGLTAPNGVAQQAVMRAAITDAGLTPRDIQYVEAHGTGTPLGDPIEMGSISDTFAESHSSAEPVVVGSVKTNVGHLESAAGVCGIVKVLLQMREGTFYPHLHLTTPSPRIPWDSCPVSVPTEVTPWPASGPRRALVNGFGIAGTLGCVVVEEPPPPARTEPARDDGAPHVLTLSAKSTPSLRRQIERYRQYVADSPDVPVSALCRTGALGRAHLPVRRAGVVRDRAGVTKLLDGWLARADEPGGGSGSVGSLRKVAFLFTGQGSQYPGMGRALYERQPVFREHLDACDRLFAPHLGRSVRDLVTGAAADGDAIHRTVHTQPALFSLEYALAQLWLSWGVRPNVLVGHSIGEIAAAAVAGVFSLEDGVALVAARARLMESVTAPGGMAQVSAAPEELAPLLDGRPDLAIACRNAPRQCVLSGGRESLGEVCVLLRDAGYEVRELSVSHAFHSPLMAEVADAFRHELKDITFHEPRLSLVSNITGRVARPGELTTPEYWVRHIGAAVDFDGSMRTVAKRGGHACVEIGPGSTLTSLARQCVPAGDHLWLGGLNRADTDGGAVLNALARLYAAGLPVSWAGVHRGAADRPATLPTYAFDRKPYWLPAPRGRDRDRAPAAAGAQHHPLLGEEVSTEEQLADGTREFATRVDAAHPAYLADHVIMGQVVLPGAAYLEVLLALQDAVYGETCRPVTDVAIREPVFLAADRTAEVRTRLRPREDGTAEAEIVTRVAGRDGAFERCHATAVLGAPEPPGAALSRAGTELCAQAAGAGEPAAAVGGEELYAGMSAAGVDYGPEFRRLLAARGHDGRLAVSELRGVRTGPAEHLPPALLDSSLHGMAVLNDAGETYLPVRFGRLRLFKKPKAAELRTVARLVPAPPDGGQDVDVSADLVLLEGDRPVFELTGLGLKRVANTTAGGGRHAQVFHEPRWIKRSLPGPGQSAGEPRRVLVLNRTAAELGDLPARAAETGTELTYAAGADVAAEFLRDGDPTDVCWFWRAGDGEGAAALAAECRRNYRDLLAVLGVLERGGAGHGRRLWLVTEGAQLLPDETPHGTGPSAAATLWGFGQALWHEYPGYRVTLVDLPRESGGDGTAGAAGPLLDEWLARDAGEFQVAYRAGLRHVRRLHPLDPAGRPDAAVRLAITEYGSFAGVRPEPVEPVPPVGDRIQVAVHSAGLNFKDVLNVLGLLKQHAEETGVEYRPQPLGFECAGTVVAAGPDAAFAPDDEVIVNALDCMASTLTVSSELAVRKPDRITMAEAAGVPTVFVTAHYALHHLAGLKPGDRVLVHAAAGGVGQAAVQLAQQAGAEVFATASPGKWPLLRAQGIRHIMNSRTLDFADEVLAATGGEGVDIVLNSLNKDFIPAGLRCLADGGRFVELGKVGSWTPEQVAEVRPDVAYHHFDLGERPEAEAREHTRQILQSVTEQLADGRLRPVPATVYALDEAEEAFSVLGRGASTGKLVLRFADDRARPARPLAVSPDRTYLVTGGLGGLGLVTARKLVELGARHLALAGRTAPPAEEAAALAAGLGKDVHVTVLQADIAEPADVERITAELKQSPYPVGGIVHAAGVLNDMPASALTWESIETVLRPKVYGSWLLHEAAASFPELDFFVGYSSVAAVLGGPAQANYAAGNAYLDGLLRWRAGHGLPALSVNWGPWAEVGMSARLDAPLVRRLKDQGVTFMHPGDGMHALVTLLGQPAPQVVAAACDWDRYAAGQALPHSLYRHLVRDGRPAGRPGLDVDELLALPADERRAALNTYLRARIADMLHFDGTDDVEPDAVFLELGLDSLAAVELKNALETALRVPLPASVTFDHPSVGQLTDFLDRQLS